MRVLEENLKNIPAEIASNIKLLAEALVRELEAEQIYLFGSFARGDWLYESDVDIIVVSSRFRGVEYGRRVLLVRRLAPKGMKLEVLAYTPEEFKKISERSVVVLDALSYAKPLLKQP